MRWPAGLLSYPGTLIGTVQYYLRVAKKKRLTLDVVPLKHEKLSEKIFTQNESRLEFWIELFTSPDPLKKVFKCISRSNLSKV